jgi:hypothetical protein
VKEFDEDGNERRVFIDQLGDYQLLNKDYAHRAM